MAGYPAKSALKIKFLPEFRAFNYQIQYKVVSAGISTFYSILTVVNLIWKKYVLFDQQSFSVEFHKVSVLVYENEPVSVFSEKSVSEVWGNYEPNSLCDYYLSFYVQTRLLVIFKKMIFYFPLGLPPPPFAKNRKNSESTQNGLNREILKKIYLPPPTKIQ